MKSVIKLKRITISGFAVFENRGAPMKISYKKLWKMLIDKDMTRRDLRLLTGISTASVAKMGRGENIYTDILLKICR